MVFFTDIDNQKTGNGLLTCLIHEFIFNLILFYF
jgi:hypothetical protein